ncbi:heme exporter protein CcmA [Moraxella macacae 0408225]|uniref:Heme exporter protein CcmA n=1 Tax=Moraxella macacae 0408225 TaxID=1230338 RepID=L2F8F4_9GAMM|nr:heme ABC exporter ATP-binding protein CcmA [Moraxella macacae]ELA09354.1 heme exporter protein CcmA [Moraxella macacae 0408225]
MPNQPPTSSSAIKSTEPVLACCDVAIQRGEFVLCNHVSFRLYQGDICHLTGENGMGKTTFIMQLAGLIPIIQGEVLYQGKPNLPTQPLYIAHQVGIHAQLSVKQNLRFLLGLYAIKPTADELSQALHWVGLAGYEDIACYQLSAGQMRRVGLSRLWFCVKQSDAIPFWLLDEPLTALDINMIAKVEKIMQDFANQGGTVLLTSHQTVSVANKTLDLQKFI